MHTTQAYSLWTAPDSVPIGTAIKWDTNLWIEIMRCGFENTMNQTLF